MRRALSHATQNDRPGTKQGTVAGMRHFIDSSNLLGLPRASLFERKTLYRHPDTIKGVSSAQNAADA
jgi:hypothetical protein